MKKPQSQQLLFTPAKLGPLMLRNRSIRAAAFEGMSQNNGVTDDLINYHTDVAKGGIGMTTVAYASVSKSGLSFPHQLWLRREITNELKKLTNAVHKEGAAASIQLGHCGNMANYSITGKLALAPSGGINWYGPTATRSMDKNDIDNLILDFAEAARIAAESGFDAVEIHAGHGYLISQFLSPFTNKRTDIYGGSFENRSRLMREVLYAVKNSLPKQTALLVKMNCYDGFEEGITKEEGIETARMIEACGADGIVVSGGFVSKAPMYVLRGSMPVKVLAHYIQNPVKKFFVKMFGKFLIQDVPFKKSYFFEDAKTIRRAVKIPVVLVGGLTTASEIENALRDGFHFVAIARALIHDTAYINKIHQNSLHESACNICNYCVAKMYSGKMSCIFHEKNFPTFLTHTRVVE